MPPRPSPAPCSLPTRPAPAGRRLRQVPGGYDLDTLPIRVDVCDGESAVSWLRRPSVRYDTPVRDLLKTAGARRAITQTSRVAGRLRNYPEIPQRLGLPPDQVRLLVNPKPLPAATATYIDTFHRGEAPVRAQSRYCPHCLTEPDPFWPDHWHSPLSLICLTHRCYLLRSCPTCLQRPQGTPAWLTRPVELHRCPSRRPWPVNGRSRRLLTWCDADLTTAPTVAAPAEEVRAQQLLHDWASGAAEPAAACGLPITHRIGFQALTELTDAALGQGAGSST